MHNFKMFLHLIVFSLLVSAKPVLNQTKSVNSTASHGNSTSSVTASSMTSSSAATAPTLGPKPSEITNHTVDKIKATKLTPNVQHFGPVWYQINYGVINYGNHSAKSPVPATSPTELPLLRRIANYFFRGLLGMYFFRSIILF